MTYGANLYEPALGFDGFGDFESGFAEPFQSDGFGALDQLDAETAALMMDVAAELAFAADSEEEADAFLPLIAALAPKVISAVAPLAKRAISKFGPKIARGVLGAGRKLMQDVGKQAMPAMTQIARGVARDTVQTVANGGQVSGQAVLRSAAQHTLPYLQDPQRAQQALQQVRQRMAQAQRRRQRPPQPQPYGPQSYGQPAYAPPWQSPSPYGQQGYGQGDYGYGPFGGEESFPQPAMPMPGQEMPEPHYPRWFS